MKWFKIILDITVLLLISTLLFLYTYKENEQLLPSSKYIVEVTDWDHQYNKKEIFDTITKFAKKEHIAIYKVIPNYQNKKINKDIYVFNPTQQTSLNSLYSLLYIIQLLTVLIHYSKWKMTMLKYRKIRSTMKIFPYSTKMAKNWIINLHLMDLILIENM